MNTHPVARTFRRELDRLKSYNGATMYSLPVGVAGDVDLYEAPPKKVLEALREEIAQLKAMLDVSEALRKSTHEANHGN